MGRTLLKDISSGHKTKKDDSIRDKLQFIEFMSKKIKVRIHYQSGDVVEHTAKVSMHTFEIEGMSYLIIPQAFYRCGKLTYIDYYYGNPRPILYDYNTQGIIIASKQLKKDLIKGKYTDNQGNIINLKDFEMLPYEQKVLFAGIIEVDSVMFNRVLTQKAVSDLWGKDEVSFTKKVWVFIAMVIIAVIITGFMIYKKFYGGG